MVGCSTRFGQERGRRFTTELRGRELPGVGRLLGSVRSGERWTAHFRAPLTISVFRYFTLEQIRYLYTSILKRTWIPG